MEHQAGSICDVQHHHVFTGCGCDAMGLPSSPPYAHLHRGLELTLEIQGRLGGAVARQVPARPTGGDTRDDERNGPMACFVRHEGG